MSTYYAILFISLAGKVILNIFQVKFQQYTNWEILDIHTGWGTRDQIANIHWIIEKTRDSQKNVSICFTDYAKAFHCVEHNKLWKIFKEMGVPDHLTFLLTSLYVGQKVEVRIRQGTTERFKIGKGEWQGIHCHSGYLIYM